MKETKRFLFVENLKEAADQLYPLHTFDPDVFVDATTSYGEAPNLSSFVLMLATVHTEIKNVSLLRSWVGSQKPEITAKRDKALGEYFGLSGYLWRISIGTVVELMKKIQESENLLETDEFKKLYAKISKDHKADWDDLVSAAKGLSVKSGPFKLLKDIRDKITFHYDMRKLAVGYKARFEKAQNDDDRPFVSIGAQQIGTRFYFADATSEGYIISEIGQPNFDSLNKQLDELLDKMNVSLFGLVRAFIQDRSALRPYKSAK